MTTRAEDYGKEIISNLSELLTEKYGKGFDQSTLYSYVRFSQSFPNILETVSPKSFLSWSQREMANHLGMSLATFNRLERGLFRPKQDTILKIQAFLSQEQNSLLPASGFELMYVQTNDITNDLSSIVEKAKETAIRYINVALVQHDWLIGQRIDEEILTTRSEDYGKKIISNLSELLTEKYGVGFTKTNFIPS